MLVCDGSISGSAGDVSGRSGGGASIHTGASPIQLCNKAAAGVAKLLLQPRLNRRRVHLIDPVHSESPAAGFAFASHRRRHPRRRRRPRRIGIELAMPSATDLFRRRFGNNDCHCRGSNVRRLFIVHPDTDANKTTRPKSKTKTKTYI